MLIPDQAKKLLVWWRELTGQHIRVPNFIQQRQGYTIATNFTREELELTVRYVRAQIAENEANGRRGLNARSMTWQNFFGDYEECEKFQSNLVLAEEWAKKRQKPAGTPVVAPAQEPGLYEAGKAAMEATLQRLKGR